MSFDDHRQGTRRADQHPRSSVCVDYARRWRSRLQEIRAPPQPRQGLYMDASGRCVRARTGPHQLRQLRAVRSRQHVGARRVRLHRRNGSDRHQHAADRAATGSRDAGARAGCDNRGSRHVPVLCGPGQQRRTAVVGRSREATSDLSGCNGRRSVPANDVRAGARPHGVHEPARIRVRQRRCAIALDDGRSAEPLGAVARIPSCAVLPADRAHGVPWNFAPKWFTNGGRNFTLIFSGNESNDAWNTIDGTFATQ